MTFEITWIQAFLIAILGCISASTTASLGKTFGELTMNRPIVAGLIIGLILGDVKTGILLAIPIQIVYIAVITPGGTVAIELRSVSYIGIPLAFAAVKGSGIAAGGAEAAGIATGFAVLVGTVGTVLFYASAMMNLIWQHWGWHQLEKDHLKSLTMVNVYLPLISQLICSFLPVLLAVKFGAPVVSQFQKVFPMDGIVMKTLFTAGSLLPAIGIAILLKSIVDHVSDIAIFLMGFALTAAIGLGLVSATIIGSGFAVLNYRYRMQAVNRLETTDEEDI